MMGGYRGLDEMDPADVQDYFYLTDPSGVELIPAQHPSGYQVLAHHRFCHSVRITAPGMDEALAGLDKVMRREAFYMGCNAVIQYERQVFWDEETYTCGGTGNCVLLKKWKG